MKPCRRVGRQVFFSDPNTNTIRVNAATSAVCVGPRTFQGVANTIVRIDCPQSTSAALISATQRPITLAEAPSGVTTLTVNNGASCLDGTNVSLSTFYSHVSQLFLIFKTL
jgi:hypothetical protein